MIHYYYCSSYWRQAGKLGARWLHLDGDSRTSYEELFRNPEMLQLKNYSLTFKSFNNMYLLCTAEWIMETAFTGMLIKLIMHSVCEFAYLSGQNRVLFVPVDAKFFDCTAETKDTAVNPNL